MKFVSPFQRKAYCKACQVVADEIAMLDNNRKKCFVTTRGTREVVKLDPKSQMMSHFDFKYLRRIQVKEDEMMAKHAQCPNTKCAFNPGL